MAVTADALDVILRVQNLTAFKAGMDEGAASVRGVGAAAKETTVASDAAAASTGRMSGAMALARKAAMGLSFAVAGITFEAVKMGVNFDKQMAMIHTQAGASVAETARMRKEVLSLNDAIASPEQLARAAYFIESVGQRGKQAMDTLHAASTGAAVGNADVVETAKTLAGIMKVDIPGAFKTAQGVMSQVNATVGSGAMTLEDYNQAMGTGILPVAKRYGLTLTDINGALAVFTDEHMQGSSATAQLATSLHFLTGATKTGEAALKKIGLTGMEMASDLRGPRGLHTALADLQAHLDNYSADPNKQNQIMQSILPGGRGRILQVLMNQLDNYSAKMDQQERTTKNYTAAVASYHQTSAFKIHHAWQQVQVQMIHLWDSIKGPATAALVTIAGALGLVTQHMHLLLSVILPLAAAWLVYKTYLLASGLLEGIGALVGGLLVLTGVIDAQTAAVLGLDAAVIANPIGLLVAAIAAAVVLIVMNWNTIKNAAVAAFNWVIHAGEDVIHWIQQHWAFAEFIAMLVMPIAVPIIMIIGHFNLIKKIAGDVAGFIAGVWGHLSGVFSALGGIVKTVWNGIVATIQGAINDIIRIINFAIKMYDKIPGFLRPTGAIPTIGLLGQHAPPHGRPQVTITDRPSAGHLLTGRGTPALAMAHVGGQDAVIHTHVWLNGREIAESVNKYNADQKARN